MEYQISFLGLHILVCLQDGKPHQIDEIIAYAAKSRFSDSDRSKPTFEHEYKKFQNTVNQEIKELLHNSLLEKVPDRNNTYKTTQAGLSKSITMMETMHEMIYSLSNIANIWKNIFKSKKDKSDEKSPISPTKGLVSYIDVLGTKSFWRNNNPSKIIADWHDFTHTFEMKIKRTCHDMGIEYGFVTFSDTIIIRMSGRDNATLLKAFSISVSKFIIDGILNKFPLRGCFSIGSYFHSADDTFFVGKIIDEAAQYYELPQWIGISASPSANLILEELCDTDSTIMDFYRKHSIPLKQSFEQDAWAIDWPHWFLEHDHRNSSICLSDVIDKKSKKLNDVSASLKWRNTRKFITTHKSDH